MRCSEHCSETHTFVVVAAVVGKMAEQCQDDVNEILKKMQIKKKKVALKTVCAVSRLRHLQGCKPSYTMPLVLYPRPNFPHEMHATRPGPITL